MPRCDLKGHGKNLFCQGMSDAKFKQKLQNKSLTLYWNKARLEHSLMKSSWIYSISIDRASWVSEMATGDGTN